MCRIFRRGKKAAASSRSAADKGSGGQKQPSLLRRLFRRGGRKKAPPRSDKAASGSADSTTAAAPKTGELSLSERVALAKAKAAARRAAAAESPPDDPTSPTAPARSSSEATNPARPSHAAASSQERVAWAQAEALLREKRSARSRQAGAKAGSPEARARRLSYGLRVALLLAAVAVVTWVYEGDIVLGVIVLICAAGVFARIVAAKVVPRIVGVVAATPFALGALIPLWNTADALLRQDIDALIQAVLRGGLYLLAVLAIFRLPRAMGGPFQKWLP